MFFGLSSMLVLDFRPFGALHSFNVLPSQYSTLVLLRRFMLFTFCLRSMLVLGCYNVLRLFLHMFVLCRFRSEILSGRYDFLVVGYYLGTYGIVKRKLLSRGVEVLLSVGG